MAARGVEDDSGADSNTGGAERPSSGDAPVVRPWSVALLDLDQENARLPEDLTDRSQPALLRYFDAAYDLEELAWSMAEKGYFPEEPLLTITSPGDENRLVVVEGNRRLATLKLLTDPDARQVVGKSFWNEMAELAADKPLQKVPTRNYDSREALLDFLGFRHVSGLLQWTADAKARFVHRLVTQYGYTFERAARVIGSRRDAIRRQFVAWRALEEARANGVDVSPAVQHFGVFFRALQNPAIRGYLEMQGWTDGDEHLLDPLSPTGVERVGELLGFVFGKRRVLKESRQLDELGRVLANPAAYAMLRDQRDLALASQELPADRDAVYTAIRLAYRNAARANAEAWQFRGDTDLAAEARRLRDLVSQLISSLEQHGHLPQEE